MDNNEMIPERATKQELATGAGHRTALDREKDTWWAVSQLAKGATYRDIAKQLSEKNGYHIAFQQVYRDIQEVMVEWKRQNMENVEAYIAAECARLEEIEQRVLADYEKSKLPSPTEYAAMIKRGLTPTEVDELYKERGGRAGDPRYLDTLLRLQKQRLDLLGLNRGNDIPSQTVVQYNFGNASMEELARMADILQDQKIDEQ